MQIERSRIDVNLAIFKEVRQNVLYIGHAFTDWCCYYPHKCKVVKGTKYWLLRAAGRIASLYRNFIFLHHAWEPGNFEYPNSYTAL